MVDFTAFEKAVDAVGGVEINVKKPVYENMLLHGKPYTLNVKTGPQKFDGLKALAYSRSRYTSQRVILTVLNDSANHYCTKREGV